MNSKVANQEYLSKGNALKRLETNNYAFLHLVHLSPTMKVGGFSVVKNEQFSSITPLKCPDDETEAT